MPQTTEQLRGRIAGALRANWAGVTWDLARKDADAVLNELSDSDLLKITRRLISAALDAEGRMYENAHIEESELIDAALALQELLTSFPTEGTQDA